MEEYPKEIWGRLGYTEHEHLYQSVDDLNKMPQHLIKQAGTLNPMMAVFFFRYIVTPENKRFLGNFVEDVVFNGQPAEEFRLKIYYRPSVSLKDQLSLSREGMLPYSNGIFSIIEVSNFTSWKGGSYANGCPLVKTAGANYLTPTPPGAYPIGKTNIKRLDTPLSIDVAFRRWIAQRAAMTLFRKEITPLEDCIPKLNTYAPLETWTEDAKIAVDGLLRERRELGDRPGEVPGFIGPDEWYM